jgi:hypothetical protein
MKKYAFAILLFALIVFPNMGHAASGCSNANVSDGVANLFPTKFCEAGDLLVTVIRILLGLISMVAVLYIVLGGYKYVTSAGNEEAAAQGRKTLTYAVIGLVIAVLAYTIVSVVNNTIGGENNAGTQNTSSTNSTNTTQPELDNTVLPSKEQAKANLISSMLPNLENSTAPLHIDSSFDLDNIKAFCPVKAGQEVSGTAAITVTYPVEGQDATDWEKQSFTIGKTTWNTSGNSVNANFTQSSHPPIEDDSQVEISVAYTVGSCRVPTITTSYTGSQMLGR